MDSWADCDPLAEVPDALRQKLQERLNSEPVIAALRVDLTSDGQFAESWLTVTPKRLLLLGADGERQLKLEAIDELAADSFVGNAYLYARANGQRVPIAHFTHACRSDIERLVQSGQDQR